MVRVGTIVWMFVTWEVIWTRPFVPTAIREMLLAVAAVGAFLSCKLPLTTGGALLNLIDVRWGVDPAFFWSPAARCLFPCLGVILCCGGLEWGSPQYNFWGTLGPPGRAVTCTSGPRGSRLCPLFAAGVAVAASAPDGRDKSPSHSAGRDRAKVVAADTHHAHQWWEM